MADGLRGDPIFIHGILPRSGTIVLWDLLLLHPDCTGVRRPMNEELFIDHLLYAAIGDGLYRTRVQLALRSRIANSLRSLRIRPAGRRLTALAS